MKDKENKEQYTTGKPESTNSVTCMACHKRTPVPASTPPFGTAIICVNCHNPLIRPSGQEVSSPLPTSATLLHGVYGYSGCYLDHPRCPRCRKLNYSIVFPEKGQFLGWYAVEKPENPQAFRITVKCLHCDKDFYVEWDENPIITEQSRKIPQGSRQETTVISSHNGKKLAIRRINIPANSEMEKFREEQGVRELEEGLGIETFGGVCTYLVPSGTLVPTTKSQRFSTSENNQTTIKINILAGTSAVAKECRCLFNVTLTGIHKAPKGVPQIEVEIGVDKEGLVGIQAKDLTSGDLIQVKME